MTKKKAHKYKVGDTMKFIFFSGSHFIGKVVKLTYAGDSLKHLVTDYDSPQYSLHVHDKRGRYSRGYMVYSNISEHRIISVNGDLKNPILNSTETKPVTPAKTPVIDNSTESLDTAIKKQKDFISGKIKK